MTTIQDLPALAHQGEGQAVPFRDLRVAVEAIETGQRGKRLKLRDGTGSRYFNLGRGCPEPGYGEQIVASGTVKDGNKPNVVFYDLRAWTPDTGQQPAPAPQQQGDRPQGNAPAQKPDYSVGTVADRVELLAATVDHMMSELYNVLRSRYDDSSAKATLIEPVVVAQLVQTASGIGQGWEKGQLRWKPGQPLDGPRFYQDGDAPDDEDVPW